MTLAVKKSWLIDFAKHLILEKLPITWGLPSGTRSEALDEEVIKALYETGCRFLCYAPESGSTKSLNMIKKRDNLNQGITKIHTTRCHSYAPGHSESPEQYQNDWSITYMQFVLANDAATSEQIDQRLAERNINMLTDNRVGGWWDGSAVRTIHNVKIRDLHPYTRLHARFVNKTFSGTAEPQSILEFGGNCTFAIDRVVNHPRIPN